MPTPSLDELAEVAGDRDMADFDAIVVGAGPAGSMRCPRARSCRPVGGAARTRPVPRFSKNMYGGVVYRPRARRHSSPKWWEEAPDPTVGHAPGHDDDDRHARRSPSTTAATSWGEAPYNGATAYRPDFDNWLAQHAVAAGAELICSHHRRSACCDDSARAVVRCHAPIAPTATSPRDVVIACDGVNSLPRQDRPASTPTPMPEQLHRSV